MPQIDHHARRHGIDDARILHAYRNAFRCFPDDAKAILVGDDGAGRLLEVGVVRTDEGDLIVHCMPARRKYL